MFFKECYRTSLVTPPPQINSLPSSDMERALSSCSIVHYNPLQAVAPGRCFPEPTQHLSYSAMLTFLFAVMSYESGKCSECILQYLVALFTKIHVDLCPTDAKYVLYN